MKPSKNLVLRRFRVFGGNILNFLGKTEFFLLALFTKLNFKRRPKSYQNLIPRGSFDSVAIVACYSNSQEDQFQITKLVEEIDAEFDRVIVVNTGKVLVSNSSPKVEILHRKNLGRDLISYKFALSRIELSETKEILFLNDSVLWRSGKLLNFVHKSRISTTAVTGLTVSNQGYKHIQTYAFHVKNAIPEAVEHFLKIPNLRTKRALVEIGERGFSKKLYSRGISFSAVADYNLLIQSLEKFIFAYGSDYEKICKLIANGVQLNPSIHLWAPLFADFGIIKKALFEHNPAQLACAPESIESATLMTCG